MAPGASGAFLPRLEPESQGDMTVKTPLSLCALLVGGSLLGALATSAPPADGAPPPAELGLLKLREDFHLAATLGDYGLMHSLWTADAVFNAAGMTFNGPDEITDFLSGSPLWGNAVNLTSESKASFDATGNFAEYAFECIIVRVDEGDPLTTSLSSIPPGSQNPMVEIVQHSNASGFAVREDGRWKFAEFNGTPGAIQ